MPATHLKKRKNTLRVEKQKTEKVSGNKKETAGRTFSHWQWTSNTIGFKKEHLKAAVFPKSKNG